jgi:hypothetical protein
MAKAATRTRSVKSPKGKSSVSIRSIDRAVRLVAEKLSGKDASRRPARSAAGQR